MSIINYEYFLLGHNWCFAKEYKYFLVGHNWYFSMIDKAHDVMMMSSLLEKQERQYLYWRVSGRGMLESASFSTMLYYLYIKFNLVTHIFEKLIQTPSHHLHILGCLCPTFLLFIWWILWRSCHVARMFWPFRTQGTLHSIILTTLKLWITLV